MIVNLYFLYLFFVSVSAFGIGSGADKDMVKQLASEGHGVAEFVESFDRSMESKVELFSRIFI